jgi:HlyD family secretion protein
MGLQSMTMQRGISSLTIIVVIATLGTAVLLLSVGGGNMGTYGKIHAGELYPIQRGSFDISIHTSGELSAQNRINIHNQLESNAVIIELVEEGTSVAKGNVLLRLNDESIKNDIRNSETSVTTSRDNYETALASLAILEKKRDSELAVRRLAIDLADLALAAWSKGEVVARRQDLQLTLQTAEKNHSRLLKKYESSVKLYEQKFLSKDELDQDEIALLNAEAALKKSLLEIEVYENYTFKQEKQKKESDLQQAKDELERSSARLDLELKSSRGNLVAKENQMLRQEEHLEKRKQQLELCVVRSPESGMVVYATSLGGRREEGEPLKVGRSLYRNELVMTIPDSSNMNASVKVNEALSGLLAKGQRATIICDAFPDVVFTGEVLSVGILATGGGWRDPNRRDYTVEVTIENPKQLSLKPSMRCTSEIFVEHVQDVLFIPIHSIHRNGAIVWVWVKKGNGYAQQEITPDRFSESYVEVSSGLEEGDVVLLRDPSPSQVVGRLELESKQ